MNTGAPRLDATDRRWLLALVGLTAVFLAVIGYPRQWSQGMLINDEFWYAHLTRSLYEGDGYVSNVMYPLQATEFDGFPVPEAMKQPGYQLVGAAGWLLTGESVRTLLVVSLLGLVGFVAAIFLLARHLRWSRPVAAGVAAATIAHPVMAQYGVQVLPESLYFACFIGTVLLILRGGTRDLIAAGALNAVLMIVKGHGLIYIPVFCAFLWLRNDTRSTARWSGAEGDEAKPDDSVDEEATPPRSKIVAWAALRPSAAKLRAVGTYVGAGVATLLVAALLLPSGSVQLVQSGGTYSQGMLIEVGRATADVPYLSVDPAPAWDYIRAHPGEYLGKVARMVKRTKLMIDTLSGPAMGGILFPALLLAGLLLAASLTFPGRLLPAADRREEEPYLLFVACLAWALLFFWPIYLSARFIIHMLPLMILTVLYVGWRGRALVGDAAPRLRRAVAVAAIVWFVVYPAAATLWDSYREPRKLLGSMLAVRFLDYDRMAQNIEDRLPADAVVISDMAHEIAWLTGRRAIAFPNADDDLAYLVDKFGVDAVYEHPRLRRDWPTIREQFTLVDEDDGFLWVRQRDDE